MYSKRFLLIPLVTSLSYFAFAKKLPVGFKVCKRNADLNNCLQDAIQSALIKLAQDGMPELGIPKLEPLQIPSVTVGGHGNVDVVQNYKNCKIYGLSKATVSNVSADLDNYKLYFETSSPTVMWLADYAYDGRMLVLPFKGEGKCNTTLSNFTMSQYLVGEKLEKNGEIFFKVIDHKVELSAGNVHFHYTNLFNGNKELSDNMHAVMNENWRSLYNDVRQLYDEVLGQIFKGLDNQIFSKVPMDAIFEK